MSLIIGLTVQSFTLEGLEIASMMMLESPSRNFFCKLSLFASVMAIKADVASPKFGFTLLMKSVIAKIRSPESFQHIPAKILPWSLTATSKLILR